MWRATDKERTPPPLLVAGEAVERAAEGTALLLMAFRATIENGETPLVPVWPTVAASLVGVMGAVSLNHGSRPVLMPNVYEDPKVTDEPGHPR